ncbi:MAG: hypothetical protein AABX14_02720, partial [Candidatus Aenigmatarchaeota archaeon]
MKLAKTLLAALFASSIAMHANAQSSEKITANYSDSQKYVCASYWNPNPRARLCYEGDDNVTLGIFLPPSKNSWKFVFGSTGGDEEAGLYFNQKKGPVTFGASVEYINGAGSGETHAGIDAGSNKVFGNNKVFLAYGNTDGASTFTAA